MDKYIYIGTTIYFVRLLASQLIYWDATRNKIGKRNGKKGFVNITAGAWGCIALLGWLGIVAIILYLYNRKKLIIDAKTNPVILSKKHRIIVHILLFIIPVGISYISS